MLGIGENINSISSVTKDLLNKKNVLAINCVSMGGLISVAELFLSSNKNIVLVCENNDISDKYFDSLKYFGINEEDIVYFPYIEISLKGKPDFALVGEMFSGLLSIDKGHKIIVTTPNALSQKLMPKDILTSSIISIKKGDPFEIDDFENKLIELGYSKGDVCDHRGIYSKRGSLIDIYPSNEELPLRINLDWDEVTEIKYFDTDTQRTTESLDYLEIFPTRGVLFNSKENKIKEILDIELNKDYTNQLKDNTNYAIEKINEKNFFDGLEFYLPYLYKETYIYDYLPKDTIFCFSEPNLIEKNFGQFKEQMLNFFKETKKNNYLVVKDYLPFNLHENIILSVPTKFTSFAFCELEPAEGFFSSHSSFSFKKTDIHSQKPDSYVNRFNELIGDVKTLSKKEKIVFATGSPFRMEQILTEYDIPSIIIDNDIDVFSLESNVFVTHISVLGGIYFPKNKLRIFTDSEVFGIKRGKKVRKLLNDTQAVKSYLDLKKKDYVVHEDYGVCQFLGVEHKEVLNVWNDFLVLQFANKILYVSTNGLDKVQKYIGGDCAVPKLSKLGGTDWEKTKTKAKKKVYEIAKELVELYAIRQNIKGYQYEQDTKWQEELEKSFPYKETKTQLKTINEIKDDLESEKPMDRLVCGDVGFGKTEVAIRAAFKVAMAGRQVAVLAPTTVLSEQHYLSFKERLAPFPQRVELLNRFRSSKEIKESLENIKTGKADIVIGTHRILSKDVEFSNLGLIIIDEEQRFGVKHKEKLKELKKNVDVLSLSATPIPRTLHMSVSGIRSISYITDAPEGRVPIKTSVQPFDNQLIKNAIREELSRGGQVFFVHNRVEDIYRLADDLEELVPEAKIDVAHGQMKEKELEEVMIDFYKGDLNVLVATTIIENGIDVSNANTIIIDNADKLGLAQLYQLRGRVGRSGRQAFAYLLYRNNMTESGMERLSALKEFSDLGSGFRIAEKDLEIRGAGNLLGKEQSGNVEGIGFEYYCKLLDEAIKELKGEKIEVVELPPVDLGIDTYISKEYIQVESLRIMFYKKLSQVKDLEALENIEKELIDRFGKIPLECKNMLDILRIKIRALNEDIASVGRFQNKYVIVFANGKNIPTANIKRVNDMIDDNITITHDRIFYYSSNEDIIKDTNTVMDLIPTIFEKSHNLVKRTTKYL